MAISYVFRPNTERYEGVRPIHIYLLRTLFLLVFLFVGFDAWSYLLKHQGAWDPMRAAAWSMFASYSLLSIFGVFRPLKLLPIAIFIVLYKSVWLLFVAYPLWTVGQLAGSRAEGMAKVFMWVPLMMLAVPWKYAFDKYVLNRHAVRVS
ncbi:MAG TPA: hypothetical protein VGQ76_00920 [Thermoanaerobaculia bacterium]|jgi:hypothetical protein|nr:hypothetical protein [Thermoanaerobaculia bacterium]